jgi:predicted PurR-regulated permease PerM
VANASTTKNRDSLFILFGLVLVTACLYWARQVLVPVALAMLLAFVLTPAVSALQRRGLGRLPSVLMVVILSLLLLSGVGYLISRQLDTLVINLPSYRGEIVKKLRSLRGAGEGGFLGRIQQMFEDVSDQMVDKASDTADEEDEEGATTQEGGAEKTAVTPKSGEGVETPSTTKARKKPKQPGTVASKPLYVQIAPSGWSRAAQAIGPAAEGLADTLLVLVLVIFMLIQRENLRNRLVRLFGHGRLITTTQAFDEGAQRISRYLLMLLLINTIFAATLTIGLLVMGLVTGQKPLWQYALLWGLMAGALRFVPYLGTWLATALAVGFSIATLPGWTLPLLVVAFFVVVELLAANVLEPLLFGHFTGVSPLALLLAAAFWTWLWGPVGLILSTPLTVVLVVLGKYVRELHFFEVLLGDEPALSTEVTYYQRLVARDTDEAADLIEDYLHDHEPEAVFEEVLLPALLLARRDHDRGDLDPEGFEFVQQGIRDTQEDLAAVLAEHAAKPAASKAVALGCPARDEADELALAMLGQLLRLRGYTLEVVSAKKLSAEVVSRIEKEAPAVICIGSLPPGGVSQARYLCKRIRQQAPNIKIVVGRWGESANAEREESRLRGAGADFVATALHESRDQILPLLQVATNATPTPATTGELVTSN